MALDTTAIVVTHNNARTLAGCLRSLAQANLPVVVVDNASQDKSPAIASVSGAMTLRNPTNQGFAAAANQGAARAKTPWLLFLNPDAALAESPAPALTYLKAHPRVGALGFALVSKHGQPQADNFGSRVTPFTLGWRHLTPAAFPRQPQAVGWVSGAAMLVRAAAFRAVGGFDDKYFLYWEDIDLCRRLSDHTWQIMFYPSITVIHSKGASSRDLAAKTKFYDESADRYFRKYYPNLIWKLQRWLRRLYRFFSPLAD